VRAARRHVVLALILGLGCVGASAQNPVHLQTEVTPSEGSVGVEYSWGIPATGGSGSLVFEHIGGQLPPGLTAPFFGSSYISGRPSALGSYTFTIRVYDYWNPSLSDTGDFTIVVGLSITNEQLKNPIAGQPYSERLIAEEGTPPYQFAALNAPAWMTLNVSTGELSGTPPSSWSSDTVWFVLADATGKSVQRMYYLRKTTPLVLPAASLPDGRHYETYLHTVGGSGGLWPYTTQLVGGTLPPNLSMSFNESVGLRLGGFVSQYGDFNFAIQVTDASYPAQTQTQAYTVRMHPAILQITTNSLPPIQAFTPYTRMVLLGGGAPPYRFEATGLPPGLALDGTTGVISGTPAQAGRYYIHLTAQDSFVVQQTATRQLVLDILRPTGRNDSIATATPLSDGQHLASFSPVDDPGTTASTDHDYYVISVAAGATLTIETLAERYWDKSAPDTVMEIVDATGARLSLCDTNGDLTFTEPCINDDLSSATLDSKLSFRPLPETAMTVYLHLVDYSGNSRPDLWYHLVVSGSTTPLGHSKLPRRKSR